MFERSLSALIKGLRSHRGKDEPKYVAQIMDEIRHEVRSGDMEVKTEAVLKLTYLQMLGYPLSGASFHMLEVMASSKYHHKHVGYLAAAQCFSSDTDVLILATNMIKKDLHSSTPLDVAIALNGLAHIVTPDLARHLGPDVIALLSHSRGVIRKKALLVLYAMIIKCPEMLEASWDRLREKLEDQEFGVVSAAVNIVCELARRDARPFLPLSPQLFRLLTTSTNNWMLIKIIKLFASLTPLEPRLVKKLVPPITTIISTTPAMSLLYECIHTMIIGGMLTQPGGDALAETCVDKLAHFLTDTDQNLKYIALLALVKILPTHPHLVAQYQGIIFESIEDPDLSIRLRALELVGGMAVSRNLESIVRQLMSHLETPQPTASAAAAALKASLGTGPTSETESSAAVAAFTNPALSPTYRLEIVNRILALGAFDVYANILDFSWYIDILLHLTFMTTNLPDDADVGATIRDQLIDITVRVRAVRPHAVGVMTDLLRDPRMLPPTSSARAANNGGELRQARKILHAAAWIVGEYCDVVPNPAAVIPLLLHPSIVEVCDVETAVSCLHNAVKLFAHWASTLSETWTQTQLIPQADFHDLRETARAIAASLDTVFSQTHDSELQERSTEYKQLFALILFELQNVSVDTAASDGNSKPPKSLNLLSPLFFSHALGPVAHHAQDRVPVPAGLDLQAWIVPQDSFVVLDSMQLDVHFDEDDHPAVPIDVSNTRHEGAAAIQVSKSEAKAQRERERQRQLDDPFYISSSRSNRKTARMLPHSEDVDDVDSIPIVQLDLSTPTPAPPVLEKEEMPDISVPLSKPKTKKKSMPKHEPEDAPLPAPTTLAVKPKKKGGKKKAIVFD